jgi:hypothetical protein
MGCVLVVFFFQDRLALLTSWLPNNRVLLRLEMTLDEVDERAFCELECVDLDTSVVRQVFRSGDVRFDLSETRTNPKNYVVDIRLDDRLCRFSFEVGDSTATLLRVTYPNDRVNCSCP